MLIYIGSRWVIAMDSDWKEFGGHERVDRQCEYFPENEGWCERPYRIKVSSRLMIFCRKIIYEPFFDCAGVPSMPICSGFETRRISKRLYTRPHANFPVACMPCLV